MILVLIIISLLLSALKSRANDGVSKTCVLSCVQQGATPLGVTAQKPVRRERASCSVKLFPGEFLVSGCILSLTEKSIKFILWISAHQRQQGGLFGGIYCLCKDTQEPPLTPHSFVPNVQTTSVDCLRPFSTPLNPAVETSGPLLRSSSSCFVSVVVFKIPLSEKQNPTMTKSRLLQQIKTRRRKNPSAHCLGSSLHCWTIPPSHCCSAKIRLPYCIKHRRDSSQQLLLNTVCDVPPQTSKLILFCKASVMHS